MRYITPSRGTGVLEYFRWKGVYKVSFRYSINQSIMIFVRDKKIVGRNISLIPLLLAKKKQLA